MSSQLVAPAITLAALADKTIRAVLRSQYDGVAALRLDSPPGAGKTGVVERLAVQSFALLRERCMVVTQTNEQAFDVARRCAGGYRRQAFILFVRKDLGVPADLAGYSNLSIARETSQLPPSGPCVIIANAARWSWLGTSSGVELFDLQVVDEAFQLPDYRFQQIAWMSRRVVLVGDPGQIDPIVTCDLDRWRGNPAGPHVASPKALLARHPDVLRMSMPVSRRLVPSTVAVVQPSFYPDLPFQALAGPTDRGLTLSTPGCGPLDLALNLLEHGRSIVQVELPGLITGEFDEVLADALVGTIERLIAREATITEDGTTRPLTPSIIGVVCAHVTQVHAIRERLPDSLADVFVETCDRFQGLERDVMLVHHPLSGRTDPDAFHLDAGRLCVMLSRHRVACIVMGRAGTEALLMRYDPSGSRVLGLNEDLEYEGWRAHVTLLRTLRAQASVVTL